MDANELNAQLMEFAKKDIGAIRNNGGLMVVGTKKGLLDIQRSEKVYTIRTLGAINFVTAERETELLYEGPKDGAILMLAGLYTVEGE